ncbi:probable prolyl 4-hydroxylase 4 isoform X1 [Papaver somniferum]|uniref:probable prolyl 4-hydroxylase 4 isoform X1 n=1 Tax=Papaver somniferum TaxID=3469 RepID=UPI000E705096|nr:probable prolyl 4-hydroxylase 4 isoform X1 [Papaver somniferum]
MPNEENIEKVNPAVGDNVSGEVTKGDGPTENNSGPTPKKKLRWIDFVSPPPWDSRSILRNKDNWDSYEVPNWMKSIPGVRSGAYKLAFGVLFAILTIVSPILQHKFGDGVTQLFLSTIGMNFAVPGKDSATPLLSNLSTPCTNITVSNRDPVTEVLLWNPRAFRRDDFLSVEECKHLMTLGDSAFNGSYRATIPKDPAVAAIEKRIATWTFLPTENGEPMKVVKTGKWQKEEEAERDYSFITVLMYLNDVESGGETVLLEDATKKQSHVTKYDLPGGCTEKGISVKPRRGTALLLFNLNASVLQGAFSIRRDCPVHMGEKWTAIKLVHVDSFSDCADMNDQCIGWAKDGECKKNGRYMSKACRKSCNEC